MNKLKVDKIKVYYVDEVIIDGTKPPITAKTKHYIHSAESQGFWASVRDLSLSESLNAAQAQIDITLQFTINWQEKLLDIWNNVLIVFKGKTYKIEGKPDQLDYMLGDMIIRASLVVDAEVIETEVYDE